jgi:hypothetical protein
MVSINAITSVISPKSGSDSKAYSKRSAPHTKYLIFKILNLKVLSGLALKWRPSFFKTRRRLPTHKRSTDPTFVKELHSSVLVVPLPLYYAAVSAARNQQCRLSWQTHSIEKSVWTQLSISIIRTSF